MQEEFFKSIKIALSTERLDAYGADQPEPSVVLARYLWNMALCESLYSPLQLCEIALRNSIHRQLSGLFGREDWFDDARFTLTPFAANAVQKAKDKIMTARKPLTSGRVISELQFGFWTSLFEYHYERDTSFLPGAIKGVFPRLPKSLHHRRDRKSDLEQIRALRNRVFHHERIIHWKDLDEQHAAILRVIGWISPELHEMAGVMDRFTAIRQQGLEPWIEKIRHHWPQKADVPSIAPANPAIAIVPDAFDATNGAETPFGRRWGGDVFELSAEHLAALQAGQTLALDVQSEYIAFLKAAESAKLEQAIKANLRGLDYGA